MEGRTRDLEHSDAAGGENSDSLACSVLPATLPNGALMIPMFTSLPVKKLRSHSREVVEPGLEPGNLVP